jgi:hypothetical protein
MKYTLLLGFALIVALSLHADTPKTPEYLFLTERISISTEDGLVGIPPGTRALVIARKEGVTTVKVRSQQFDVEPYQFTTDLNAATALARQDAAAQKAAKQSTPAAADASLLPSTASSGDQLRAVRNQRNLIELQITELYHQKTQIVGYSSKTSPNAARNKQQRDAIQTQIDALQAIVRKFRHQETLILIERQ